VALIDGFKDWINYILMATPPLFTDFFIDAAGGILGLIIVRLSGIKKMAF